MKKRLKTCFDFLTTYRLHFIVWSFFIFYEIILTGILRGYFASAGNYFIFYFLNISLFYFHAHIILPTANKNPKHNVWLRSVLILLEVAIYVPLTIGIVALLQKYADLSVFTPAVFNKASLGNGLVRTIYFLLFSTGYYYLTNYIKERKVTQQAEKDRLLMIIENQNIQAELIRSQHAHLKAQINPHFLFNTLSFIYTNTRKSAPEAAEAIMSLSEMMRYALQEDDDETFTLVKLEIEQVENLIKLHQIRAEHQLNIVLKYDSEVEDVKIIPLVLLTLVENIFKHGDLSKEHAPALISLCTDGNTLIIETENLISTNNTKPSHYIGLDNTKKRLSMVYGTKAMLDFDIERGNYFSVCLRIALN